MPIDNIRPIKDRVFIGLWALWILFFVIPVLLSIFFGVATFPFEEVKLLGGGRMNARELEEWRIGCLFFSALIFVSGAVGSVAQFVAIGYASPVRLLRRRA